MTEGTPIDVDKLRSLHIGRIHRTRVEEGRQHPETGRRWKAVTEDGSGLTTTEHDTPDDRVDAVVRPATVRAVRNPATGRLENQ
jgi:hypothetical protein